MFYIFASCVQQFTPKRECQPTVLTKVVDKCLNKSGNVHGTRDCLREEKQDSDGASKLRTECSAYHNCMLVNDNTVHPEISNN